MNFTREECEHLLRLATDEAKTFRAFLAKTGSMLPKKHKEEMEADAEKAERLMLKVAEYLANHWRDDDNPKAEVRAAREEHPHVKLAREAGDWDALK